MIKKIIINSLAIFAFFAYSNSALSSVPAEMHFQGVLTDNDGVPLNGQHAITVSLYDSEQDGNLLWTQISQLEVVGGVVDVVLGEETPLTVEILAAAQLWLGVQVDADDELAPRQKLVSVPYATRASYAEAAGNVPDADQIAEWAGQAGYALEAELADQDIATAPVAWAGLVGIPEGFADGTDDGLTTQDVQDFLVQYGYITEDAILDFVTYDYLETDYMTSYNIMALIASYYTKEEMNVLLEARPELGEVLGLLEGYYTKGEMDILLAARPELGEVLALLAGYYTRGEVDVLLATRPELDEVLALLAGYYSIEQVDALLLGYAALDHTHPWAALTDVPAGFADGIDDDTQYMALEGGGLELSDGQFSLLTSCEDGQLLKWNSGLQAWYCADDMDTPEIGDIEGVVAGAGLLGGAASGTATLSVNTEFVQQRVKGTCTGGGIGAIGEDGQVVCNADNDTLAGLTCTDGQVLKFSTLTLSWTCADDMFGTGDITAVVAGTGLLGGAQSGSAELSVDPTVFQRRVSGTCATGGIRAISDTGAVTCDVDADTLAGLSCPSGQTAKWNGTSWACGADKGIVSAVHASGPISNLATTTGWTFLPSFSSTNPTTATVTVTSGQQIMATATVAIGTGANAAQSLSLALCVQPSAGGSLTVPNNNYLEGLKLGANQRVAFTVVNLASSLAAGSYKVGPCYQTSDANWVSNDWNQVIATVIQP